MNVQHTSLQFLSKKKCYWFLFSILKARVSYMKKWSKCQSSLPSAPLPSLSYRKWFESSLLRVLHGMQAPAQSEQLQRHSPSFWNIPEGQWWTQVCPACWPLSSQPCCSVCFKREMPRSTSRHQLMDCDQWFGWMVRDLKGTWLENWWQGDLRKR